MPLHTETEPAFTRLETRHSWFARVLEVEYGEAPAPGEVPPAFNWLLLLPLTYRYDFDEVECSLAYTSPNGYACTVWEASGEDDLPWAVFVVDDAGTRFLPEYSVLDENADEQALNDALKRGADELPRRLEAGEFDRDRPPLVLPTWLGPDDQKGEH